MELVGKHTMLTAGIAWILGGDPTPFLVHNALAIFLREGAELRRQQIEHILRRATQFDAYRGHYDGTIDQDGMSQHRIEKLVIAQSRVGKAKFGKRRSLFAQQGPHGNSHAIDQLTKEGASRRRLEIFNDMRLDTRIADQCQCVARRAAIWVVVDDDVHQAETFSVLSAGQHAEISAIKGSQISA